MSKKLFTVKKRKVLFSKGPIHLVDCDVSMRDGRILSRQVLEHPGAVVIIPKIGKDRYLLVRQFRFAARAWLWEFPAGGIERGEKLKRAAARELMEETDFRPRRLRKLCEFYPTPGISGEIMYLFLAEDLTAEKGIKDEDEDIEVGEFTLRQMERMILSGMICDGKTILGYYFLKERRNS